MSPRRLALAVSVLVLCPPYLSPAEKFPDRLRPGYDGETLLLGPAMLEHTRALVHLARCDGHLSRRFFRAVKQLADLRRDERKSSPSADSYLIGLDLPSPIPVLVVPLEGSFNALFVADLRLPAKAFSRTIDTRPGGFYVCRMGGLELNLRLASHKAFDQADGVVQNYGPLLDRCASAVCVC